MRQPRVVHLDGLPTRVQVFEVGSQEELQNEAQTVRVEDKAEFITRVISARLNSVHLSSFVLAK